MWNIDCGQNRVVAPFLKVSRASCVCSLLPNSRVQIPSNFPRFVLDKMWSCVIQIIAFRSVRGLTLELGGRVCTLSIVDIKMLSILWNWEGCISLGSILRVELHFRVGKCVVWRILRLFTGTMCIFYRFWGGITRFVLKILWMNIPVGKWIFLSAN